MNESSALDILKGIGEKTKLIFERAGIYDIGDLLAYYPRNYETLGEITEIAGICENEIAAVYGTIVQNMTVKRVKQLQITATQIRDSSGVLNLTWYHMPYLKNTLKRGGRYVFRGRIVKKKQQLYMEQPAVFDVQTYESMRNTLQPIYTLREGMTNKIISKAVHQALEQLDLSKEYLPEEIRREWNLAEYNFALEQIHFPKDMHNLILARNRLVFDEFLLFILALRSLKSNRQAVYHSFHIYEQDMIGDVIKHLGFSLTKSQMRVLKEIEHDLTGPRIMARLIQGDVGSGKTILAVLALLLVAANGYQGAMMVPTEILAQQHYESVRSLLEEQHLDFKAVLLTGSMSAKEKRQAYTYIESGEADIIIGTHAMIQENVRYAALALVITDEQHRFGVKQRESLETKGGMPHTLVMSATPIPRTLAVILYGDLDISVIDELPANRLPIKNCVVGISYRKKAYEFIHREITRGRQAYVICPMVEESEHIEAENVLEYTNQLRNHMPKNITVEYLHGKMNAKEKNMVMQKFLKNKIQVLVSTTVVEVGVNVPNATIMMIENSERFGLAQLHQLRGRVGRGSHQSYCIMVHTSDNQKIRERLEIMNRSNDGFYIAGEDLKLRGPGDLFGIRQSGGLEFKIGDVFQDAKILQAASTAAEKLLWNNEILENEKYIELKRRLERYLHQDMGKLNL